jgi:hypothetical protein
MGLDLPVREGSFIAFPNQNSGEYFLNREDRTNHYFTPDWTGWEK